MTYVEGWSTEELLAAMNDRAGVDERSRARERPRAWDWRELSPVQAEVAMEELAHWVRWVVGRYDMADQLPCCWADHGWAVEELGALYAAWRGAYQDPDASSDALDWHEAFDRARERLREWDRYGCGTGVHRTGPAHLEILHKVGDGSSPPPSDAS